MTDEVHRKADPLGRSYTPAPGPDLLFFGVLPGPPEPATRHRSRIAWRPAPDAPGGRVPFIATYHEHGYAAWKLRAEESARAQWRGREPIAVPLLANVVVVLPRPVHPVRTYRVRGIDYRYPFPWTVGRNPHTGREDMDNLRKAALDALVGAGVLADDRLVVVDSGSKWYAGTGEIPGTEVRLWRAV
jgi:Holliday junction resolvase RusA-like endonuclease